MKREPQPEALLITRDQAAKMLAVCRNTLISLEKQGIFTPIRLGKSIRYRRADLEATISRLADEQRPKR